MDSGYWFLICLNIQTCWDICKKGGDPPVDFITSAPADYDETNEEYMKHCHDDIWYENYCRNTMLRYFSDMHESTRIFSALMWLPEFRKELIDSCTVAINATNEFDFFDAEERSLNEALWGLSTVQRGLP